jgi:hypothetical protein
MKSRERVRRAINHKPPDKVPLDLGSTSVTGIHASAYATLKKAFGVNTGEIKVVDPFQMLAEVEDHVKKQLGVDTYGIQLPYTIFGFKNENWKPWKLFDGTEVLVSEHFQYDIDANGDILLYPQGDRSALPSGRMPNKGYYFDNIVRQEAISDDSLDPKEWVNQSFSVYTDEEVTYLHKIADWAYNETDYCIVGNFCDGGLGDMGIVPGPNVKNPKGIRDHEEWYMSLITRKNYIMDIFGYQTELALKNLEMYHQAVKDKIDVIDISETDFGGQNGLLFSKETFKELFMPFFKEINDWVHINTEWKTFYHTCGSVAELIEDFIEIGIDILNPVQHGAENMDLLDLKAEYGDKIVFWGAGIDSQHILPFGKPEEVEGEVIRNMKTLSKGGGFVFSVVHNIQPDIPQENIKTLFETFKRHRDYDSLTSP